MSLDSGELREKAGKLRADVDNLTFRVEKLCDRIDSSLPLLSEISVKMNDHMERSKDMGDLLKKSIGDIGSILVIQEKHSDIIETHSMKIKGFEEMSQLVKSAKFYLKTIAGFSLFCFAVAGGWYAYDRNRDRNYAHEMSMKKLQFEMEEKKKKADYTREKYLIRNGISDPDANSSVLN